MTDFLTVLLVDEDLVDADLRFFKGLFTVLVWDGRLLLPLVPGAVVLILLAFFPKRMWSTISLEILIPEPFVLREGVGGGGGGSELPSNLLALEGSAALDGTTYK